MTKPAVTTLGDISLNRLAVCECSDFNVCFVLEPFGVSDGPLSLHHPTYVVYDLKSFDKIQLASDIHTRWQVN